MPLYPLFADLRGREVLVVGAGEVATRKVEALLHAGARVCVCAPELGATLARWHAAARLEHRPQAFDPDWLDAFWLVVAATDDGVFNARLAAEAGQRKRLANIVDDAALSTFQVPAIVDRAPLLVAISSSGAAPMLARRLRAQLETQLDASWGRLANLFARHRDAIRQRFPELAQRRRWYDAIIDGPVPALLRADQDDAAERALLAALDAPVTGAGGVALIVADGDPEQLTLRALRVMNQADVLFHHDGIDPGLLALARRDAPREPFVKPFLKPDGFLVERVVTMAGQGKRVVVLDTADTDASSRALSAGLEKHGGALELITCAGAARFL
ncbi:NAD(P)-dependent oxidoreductase [Marilutibacter alkalisoli]|uniref:precorrin-2 dehydrogenase n=1 Tax=Marilutibacter alkalisoli TaxID=2591633 RepID=A0A514BPG5_9GAMM|nr:NAD(P)-dependent oxidoreductase [Lysobacter alkalisoli]QDH69225.1 siroheme synthase [Lysobacter alkalisoli]